MHVKLIGAFSDKCTSRLGKRRPFIIVAGLLTCLSMIGVAYARELGYYGAKFTTSDPESVAKVVSFFLFLSSVQTKHSLTQIFTHIRPMTMLLLLQ